MSTVPEIESAVRALPPKDLAVFRTWFGRCEREHLYRIAVRLTLSGADCVSYRQVHLMRGTFGERSKCAARRQAEGSCRVRAFAWIPPACWRAAA
jgi:hypothetical protein